MTVTVKIPTQLRESVGGAAELEFSEVATLRDLLGRLRGEHPSLLERISDENGELRRFVNVYVGDEDVRFLDGMNTELQDGSVVSILPAVAGGSLLGAGCGQGPKYFRL